MSLRSISKLLGSVIVFSMGMSSNVALGCSTPSEERRLKHSDLVVEGSMYCDSTAGYCRLRASSILKGYRYARHGKRVFRIPFPYEAHQRWSDDMSDGAIICGSAGTWLPDTRKYRGTFYLRRGEKGQWVQSFFPVTERDLFGLEDDTEENEK